MNTTVLMTKGKIEMSRLGGSELGSWVGDFRSQSVEYRPRPLACTELISSMTAHILGELFSRGQCKQRRNGDCVPLFPLLT